MTSTEYEEWIEYHCLAFPALREQFTAEPGMNVVWVRTLKRVSLKAAKLATEDILGDPPRFLSEHPSRVIKFAKANKGIEGAQPPKPMFQGDERVYTCAQCRDSGMVLIFSVLAMRAMRDGTFGWKESHGTVAAACNCAWGQRMAEPRKLPVYHERQMVLASGGHDLAAVERLAAFFGVPVPNVASPVYERLVTKQTLQAAPPSKEDLLRLSKLACERAVALLPPASVAVAEGPVYDESEATVGMDEGPWHEGMDIAF